MAEGDVKRLAGRRPTSAPRRRLDYDHHLVGAILTVIVLVLSFFLVSYAKLRGLI